MVGCGLVALCRALVFVHHALVRAGWMTLVALPPTVNGVPTDGEPTPVTFSGRDLVNDSLSVLVWGGLAACFGFQGFG